MEQILLRSVYFIASQGRTLLQQKEEAYLSYLKYIRIPGIMDKTTSAQPHGYFNYHPNQVLRII